MYKNCTIKRDIVSDQILFIFLFSYWWWYCYYSFFLYREYSSRIRFCLAEVVEIQAKTFHLLL